MLTNPGIGEQEKRSKYRTSFVLGLGSPNLKQTMPRSCFSCLPTPGLENKNSEANTGHRLFQVWAPEFGILVTCICIATALVKKDNSLHRPRREYVCCAFVMARSQCCQIRLLVRARCCLPSPSVAIDHPSSSSRADLCAQFEEAQALRPCRRKGAGRNRHASIRSREGS